MEDDDLGLFYALGFLDEKEEKPIDVKHLENLMEEINRDLQNLFDSLSQLGEINVR